MDLLGEVGGFEGIVVVFGLVVTTPLTGILLKMAMMKVFKPHSKVNFSTREVYSGAFLPRCCLKSKKFKQLDEAEK